MFLIVSCVNLTKAWTGHNIKYVVQVLGWVTSRKQEWWNKVNEGRWERQRRHLEKEWKIELMAEEEKEWDKE